MPTYQYRCKDCDNELEVVQKFTDDPLTDCPVCEDGALRKVFNAVGVVFKGSGFYRTDSRRASTASDSTASDSTKKASDSGSSASSAGSQTKTPAASSTSTPAPAPVGSPG